MKPVLYLYCQHSVGMGHFVRSLALARVLAEWFEIHFLNGGRSPPGFNLPDTISFHHLSPLGMGKESQLTSLDESVSVEEAKKLRVAAIRNLIALSPPDLVLTELYPFGRKKFAFELEPLIQAARNCGAAIVCSVRDLLVSDRPDQQRHDDRTAQKLNAEFDAVIVHADPRFARLEESFRPLRPPRTRVHYSGFVVPHEVRRQAAARERRVLISAGGGLVGGALFRTALAFHHSNFARTGRPMTIVAGPFLPESEWSALRASGAGVDGLTLERSVPDLCALMCAATHSISQCGYNTAIDILVSGVSALVVPYATEKENEQTVRAERLAAMGRIGVLQERDLSADAVGQALERIPVGSAAGQNLALDGARETARILDDLLIGRKRGRTRAWSGVA
jgi:predicted glycosyltransferase